MLSNILNKFKGISDKEKIIFPEMGKSRPNKSMKIQIFIAEKAEDFTGLRAHMEGTQIIFVNIRALMGNELTSFVKRVQIFSQQRNLNICGLDKSWIVISQNKIEKI